MNTDHRPATATTPSPPPSLAALVGLAGLGALLDAAAHRHRPPRARRRSALAVLAALVGTAAGWPAGCGSAARTPPT